MTTVLLPAPTRPARTSPRGSAGVVRVRLVRPRPADLEDERQARVLVLVLSAVLSLVTLPLVVGTAETGEDHRLPTALAVLALVPLLGHLVWCRARGVRSRWALLELGAIAALTIALTPVVGVDWLGAYGALALAVLVVLPAPWSGLTSVAVVLAMFPVSAALGRPAEGMLSALLVTKAHALYAVLWMVSAVRQLHATRRELADRAVALERQRVDEDLGRTVAADLEAVLAEGERLSAADALEREAGLTVLVARSRSALAAARRVVTGYRSPSLRTELDGAAALLRASGRSVRVLAPTQLPEADEPARLALRQLTAELLRSGTDRPLLLVVSETAEGLVVSVATDGPVPA